MKKVGLLTFHASHNIGSMLQTYAMQHILEKKFGCNVEIIDFSSKSQQEMYAIFNKGFGYNPTMKNIAIVVLYSRFKSRWDDFNNFIEKNFKLTPRRFSSCKELASFENDYDYVICGSDQIWNTTCTDFDDAYFLPFRTTASKIAYGPSFGGRNILDSKYIDLYEKYLDDFDHLSARELNGKKWLESITNRDVTLVPDPTLLVEKEIWNDLVTKHQDFKEYIFFYGVPFAPETYGILKEIGKKLRMPIIMLDIKSWVYRGNFLRGIKLAPHCGPGDYLSLIKNAKIVITTSFHGTIFSTIYRKDFWTLTFKGTNKDDDRIATLLKQLGLNDRLIYLEDIENINLEQPVNYEGYEAAVDKLKVVGMSYLNNALNND